jgi:hypothetical protein
MRVFFHEKVLNFPDIVEAESVGEFDLRQSLPIRVVFTEGMPRTGSFHFVQ